MHQLLPTRKRRVCMEWVCAERVCVDHTAVDRVLAQPYAPEAVLSDVERTCKSPGPRLDVRTMTLTMHKLACSLAEVFPRQLGAANAPDKRYSARVAKAVSSEKQDDTVPSPEADDCPDVHTFGIAGT